MRSTTARAAGLTLMVAGVVVLALVGTYLGLRTQARSGLDDLNFSTEQVERLPGSAVDQSVPETAQPAETTGRLDVAAGDAVATAASPGEGSRANSEVGLSSPSARDYGNLAVTVVKEQQDDVAAADTGLDADAGPSDGRTRSIERLAGVYAAVYADLAVHPRYWHEPLRAAAEFGTTGLPEGFEQVSALDRDRFSAPRAAARRLSIPAIGVDSDVEELAIVDLGDSRSYETPKNTIGHIPNTADPGELGNGWFFGHLESPFRGEGNVFHRLPEIAELLRHYSEVGEGAVYVVVESDAGEYLYQVIATQVVHASDLSLYETEGVYITLVTCVPRLDYTHRLLVTAKLVGVGL